MNESDPKIENKEGQKKRILLADDSPSVLFGISALLEFLGYEVVTAENGQELLDKLNSGEKFDAVITDIQMPGVDGVSVLEQIRQNPNFKELPVIVHSGTWDRELEKKVDKLGGKRLQKPYGEDVLKSVLKDIFDNAL